jgi:hypothetical protein
MYILHCYAWENMYMTGRRLDRWKKSLKAPRTIQRFARIAELEEWSGMTSKEMLEKAEGRTLGGDPYYAEWLVLLGRGELL